MIPKNLFCIFVAYVGSPVTLLFVLGQLDHLFLVFWYRQNVIANYR